MNSTKLGTPTAGLQRDVSREDTCEAKPIGSVQEWVNNISEQTSMMQDLVTKLHESLEPILAFPTPSNTEDSICQYELPLLPSVLRTKHDELEMSNNRMRDILARIEL
jgi:hypothetical protein